VWIWSHILPEIGPAVGPVAGVGKKNHVYFALLIAAISEIFRREMYAGK